MNVLDILEEYIGEELTAEYAERLSDAPPEHIGGLMEKLAPHYYDWLEKEETAEVDVALDRWLPIESLPEAKDWRESLERVKKLLLYFPRLVVPDPLATALHPPITHAQLQSKISGIPVASVPITENLRREIRDALVLLASLREAVKGNDIILMPKPFCMVYESVQDGARQELASIAKEGEDKYHKPILVTAKASGTSERGARMVVEEVIVHGQICPRLQLTPVAADSLIRKILTQDYRRGTSLLGTPKMRAPKENHYFAESLVKYEVPRVKADLAEVLKLRKDEEAFFQWRRDFGKVLSKAYEEGSDDKVQFEVEFRRAADEVLVPRIEELKKVTKSSLLQTFFIPAGVAIGAGAAAYWGASLAAFPPGAVAGAAIAPLSWAVQKAIRRYNKAGRRATMLREFYAYLIEK